MTLGVIFSQRAEDHLAALYLYIAERSSTAVAASFTDDIIDYCLGLEVFPLRGRLRGEVRANLRTITFRKRVLIAYEVASDEITILGVFYGGQDFEARFDGPEGEA